MKILILGGFGFLGGRIANFLTEKGYSVTLGSRQDRSRPSWLPNAKVCKIDWENLENLRMASANADIIVYASGMNANDCKSDPQKAHKVNGTHVQRFVLALEKLRYKKLIFLSTSHVYSDMFKGDIDENTLTRNPHPYATSNLAGEKHVLNMTTKHNKRIILRLSNGFGAPLHKQVNCWSLVVNELCKKAIESKELILTSDGKDKRDFITISDICYLIWFLIKYDFNQIDTLNVGSGSTISTLDMAKLIQSRFYKILRYKPIIRVNKAENNLKKPHFTYNIKKMIDLGFTPQNNFNFEVDRLIEFCAKNFNNYQN